VSAIAGVPNPKSDVNASATALAVEKPRADARLGGRIDRVLHPNHIAANAQDRTSPAYGSQVSSTKHEVGEAVDRMHFASQT